MHKSFASTQVSNSIYFYRFNESDNRYYIDWIFQGEKTYVKVSETEFYGYFKKKFYVKTNHKTPQWLLEKGVFDNV